MMKFLTIIRGKFRVKLKTHNIIQILDCGTSDYWCTCLQKVMHRLRHTRAHTHTHTRAHIHTYHDWQHAVGVEAPQLALHKSDNHRRFPPLLQECQTTMQRQQLCWQLAFPTDLQNTMTHSSHSDKHTEWLHSSQTASINSQYLYGAVQCWSFMTVIPLRALNGLQCFDTVGWVAGRASGLKNKKA